MASVGFPLKRFVQRAKEIYRTLILHAIYVYSLISLSLSNLDHMVLLGFLITVNKHKGLCISCQFNARSNNA
jgi:hypothetical protein